MYEWSNMFLVIGFSTAVSIVKHQAPKGEGLEGHSWYWCIRMVKKVLISGVLF